MLVLRFLSDHYAEVAAISAGVVFYKYLNNVFRLVLLYLIISFGADILGFLVKAVKWNSGHNTFIYNLYIPVNFALLLLIAYKVLKDKYKRLSSILYFLIAIIWLFDTWEYGINVFAIHAFCTGIVITIPIYLYLLYKAVLTENKKLWFIPVFWLCLAVIIFYGVAFSNITLAKELSRLTVGQQQFLRDFLYFLNTLQNVMIAYSFLFFYVNHRKTVNGIFYVRQ